MCFSAPERIEEITADGAARVIGPQGVRTISLALVGDAGVGDYVTVQSGFAIRLLPEGEADRVLALLREAGLLVAAANSVETRGRAEEEKAP